MIYFIFIRLCVSPYVRRSSQRPEEGTGDPGAGVIDNCGGRELDAGLLMEHQVLLTSELSFQSLKYMQVITCYLYPGDSHST